MKWLITEAERTTARQRHTGLDKVFTMYALRAATIDV
jgi:hypothetical protein